MTAKAVLKHLRSLGARVSVVGDKIHVEAPVGILTPDLKAALAENKPALLKLLRPFSSPVLLGSDGQDPLDYRFNPLTGAWTNEPNWWTHPLKQEKYAKHVCLVLVVEELVSG